MNSPKRTGWKLVRVKVEGHREEEWERIGGAYSVVLVQNAEAWSFFTRNEKGMNLAAGQAPSREVAWLIATGIR